MKLSTGIQRLKYVLSDWVLSSVAFFIFNIIRSRLLYAYQDVWNFVMSPKLLVEQATVPLLMLGIYWLSGYYNRPFGKSRLQEMMTTFFSALINTGIIFLILLINDQTGERKLNYEMLIILFGLLFLLPYMGRMLITLYATSHFRHHQWEFRTLIVGNTREGREMADRLENGAGRVGYKILGFIEGPDDNGPEDDRPVYPLDKAAEVCRDLNIEQLVIAPGNGSEEKVLHLLYRLFNIGIPIKIAPDTLSYVTSAIRINDIYAEPFIDLTAPTLSESAKNVKLVADIVTSVLLLTVLLPVYAVLAILVKYSSPGPVFYSQERIGLRRRPFRIYKFRTMRQDAEASGPRLSAEDDPRITPIGKILRKYRLDELPQFWNVLKGDMSIVGPRPERAYFIEKIMKEAPYYAMVWQVRPGITSWGMVKYGYASTVAQMVERTRFDLIYLSNMSLLVDLKILIYTVKTVITGRGL